MQQSETSPEYKRRYISFLDVLGFSDLIELTRADPEELAGLVNALDFLQWPKRLYEGAFVPGEPGSKMDTRCYMFSDSIVHTAPVTPDGLGAIFESVSDMCRSLLRRAILARGAIVVGDQMR